MSRFSHLIFECHRRWMIINKMFHWIIFLSLFTFGFSSNLPRAELEKKIISSMYIERRFNSYIRPRLNDSQLEMPVEVNVNLHILHLNIDTRNQNFDISIYFRQEWNDSRVSYNNEGIIDSVTFHDVIGFWTPDLFFVNELTSHFHIVTKPNTFARIYHDGRVLFSQRLTIKALCPMNLRKYPFDKQICPLYIESYGYTIEDLIVKWKDTGSPITGSPDVDGYIITFKHNSYRSSIIDEAQYSTAELEIHAKRLLTDFFLHIYIPLTIFLLISWIPFWMTPKQSILRIILSLTVIGSSLFEININNHLFINPGYATALDAWVAFICTLLFASFLINIYVIYDYQEEIIDKSDAINKNENSKVENYSFLNQLTKFSTKINFIVKIAFPVIFLSFQLIYIICIFI